MTNDDGSSFAPLHRSHHAGGVGSRALLTDSNGSARCHARVAASVVAVLAGLAATACGPRAQPPTVSMRMTGGPPTATVTVDDQFVGSLAVVAARGVALPAGKHHVTVEAPGYLSWDKPIEAKEGQGPVRLDVTLTPIPD